MATTRLRRVFRYPSDDEDSNDDDHSAMDEEQQEQLIASLQADDARKTEFYRRAFLILPLCSALFVVYAFVFDARTARQRLVAVLAASSLACTTYVFHFHPVQHRRPTQPSPAIAQGPTDRHLLWLNAALASVLGLAALLSWTRGATERALQEALPLMVFAILMFARTQLAPLNLEQLQKARFNLKGA